MNQVIDKGILLLLCSVFLFQADAVSPPVIAFLITFVAAALGIYLQNKHFKIALLILLTVIGLILPELLLFLPVLAYDCFQEKISAGAMLLIPVLRYAGMEVGIANSFLWLALCALSLLMALRTARLLTLEQQMIRLRDTSTELNLVLEEKNKDLMEKQDYEIYLATLRERNRIAREIHDHVGHMLSRSILQVGALATIHKEEPLQEQLTQINETLNLAMTNIRESVHDLHDDSIDLKQAITEAVNPLMENHKVTVDYDMSPAIPKNIKYCLISTVKEVVSNILKHSDCDRVSFIFREHPGFYQLSAEDNGTRIAFSAAQLAERADSRMSEGRGIGLMNMQNRVKALGGTFHLHTDHGFQIFLSIPKNEQKGGKL